MDNLTEKQRNFVEEYIKDYNATQAAKRAGYSERTAHNSGYRNVNNDEIKLAIKKRQEEMRSLLQQQFASDAIVARKIMYNLMNDKDVPEQVRLSAAKDFLDRSGYKPVDKVEQSGGIEIKVDWHD